MSLSKQSTITTYTNLIPFESVEIMLSDGQVKTVKPGETYHATVDHTICKIKYSYMKRFRKLDY